ncbi:MAG: response regulator [Rhizobacter sp.]|nr:response regulator [Bacteriovorax sp.]
MEFSELTTIQKNRNNLLHYLDKSPVGLCIFSGPDNVYTMVNEQYKAFLGDRNFIGRPAREVVPELADQVFGEILKNIYATGEVFSEREMPVTYIHADGLERTSYLDLTFQPIFTDGKVTSVIQISLDVTDHVMTKKVVDENFSCMKSLADNMPQIVWKADSNGLTYYLNKVWNEYTGSSEVEKWCENIHPDDYARTKEVWAESIQSGKKLETEFRLKRKDGVYEWHLTRANPEISAEGKITHWYGTSTNIEEQKVLANELSTAHLTVESERQKFETLFHNTPAAMAILKGPNLIFERVNDEYLKLVNHRDIIGKPMAEALPEILVQPGYFQRMKDVFITGETYTAKETKTVLTHSQTDSNALFIDVTYKRMNFHNGGPYGIFIYASEVTEKVQAIKKIQESEKEFRALADAMPQIIFTADAGGDVTYFNERWEEYTGYSPSESLGWKWSHVHHPEDIDRVMQTWKNSLMTGKPYQCEYRIKGKDGQYRWFLARALPTRDSIGNITKWIGTNTDINDQKVISQKLEFILDEVKSSKLLAESANDAKSAFLANMSHEIRTPLGSIMGFIGLMRNPDLSHFDLNKYISIAERNSEQLLRIIDDILDLSKVEAGKLVIEKIDFNLTDILADIASLMEFRAQENGIKFEIRAMTELPEIVNSDPTRIKQILMNAVGNAIKFTQRGTVELQVSYINQRLKFAIIDSGVGISEKQAAQLFQPFTQADVSTTRKYGGTGLGLTLTKLLCETMNGEFYLQKSQLGIGSTFIATVKVDLISDTKFFTEARSHFYKPAVKIADKNALHDLNILVIDDLEDNLTLIRVLLSDVGAEVTTISDPYIGISAALEGEFDIILMDIQMPLMNGYEVTKRIRQAGKSLPIIALTAHAMKEEKMRALNFGFSGFLAKPINANELIQTIQKLTEDQIEMQSINRKVAIVEDDPDLRDLLEAMLQNQRLDVIFCETGEELIEHLKTNHTPELILVDLFLPKMSGSELIPLLNARADREKFKVVIASGSDDISGKVKNLRADGYLKKPYNSRSIVDSIKAFLL